MEAIFNKDKLGIDNKVETQNEEFLLNEITANDMNLLGWSEDLLFEVILSQETWYTSLKALYGVFWLCSSILEGSDLMLFYSHFGRITNKYI